MNSADDDNGDDQMIKVFPLVIPLQSRLEGHSF
jgi:hypothetical protein